MAGGTVSGSAVEAGGRRAGIPATVAAEGDPTADWPASWRAVFGVLRSRPLGTTASQVAAMAGLAERHVHRTLDVLADQGFARCGTEKVVWGCGLVEVSLWRLDLTESCVRALAFVPRRCEPFDDACPPGVPAEFWPMFWSGSRGSDAVLPRDAFDVACTLLDCGDRAAQAWALQYMPLGILERCRSMRGYDVGEIAAAIDAAVAERRWRASV